MKRTLALVLLVTILLGIGKTRAYATDMGFGGEYRIRGWWLGKYNVDDRLGPEEDSAYWDQRFRLTMETKLVDNVQGFVRLLVSDNDAWDSQEARPGNREVDFDLAYLKLNVPYTPFALKLGRIDLRLGHYLVLGSTMTYDALLAEGAQQGPESVQYGVFTAKIHEGRKSAYEDDIDLYGAYLNMLPQPDFNVGLFGVFGNHAGKETVNRIVDSTASNFDNAFNQAFWIGVTSDVTMDPLKFQFEFDYSQLTLDKASTGYADDTSATGFAAYGNISGMVANMNIGGSVLYASGDENGLSTNPEDRDSFSPIRSTFSDMNKYDLITLYWVRNDVLTNIMAYQIYLEGKMLNDKIAAKLSAQYYQLDKAETIPGVAEPREKTIGTEIDARFSYNIFENLTFTGKAGLLLTDDEYFGADSDNIWLLGHEWVLSF
ncbi:MAG: hypothetical protein AB1847_07765 [bacterium]